MSPFTLTGLSLFNNIIVPLLAEGFASPNCFQYATTAPSDISTLAERIECFSLVVYNASISDYTALVRCPNHLPSTKNDVMTFTYYIHHRFIILINVGHH
jgi:hypothetical protein